MGAKNFLPRFNATSGTSPDIGSNTLTIHGEGSHGQGQNLTARWGTIFANEGNFRDNLSIGQSEVSGGATSTTNQITFGDDFYIGQNNSATTLSIGTGTDVSANTILSLSSSNITPAVNITSSAAISGSVLNASTFFIGPAFYPTTANFIVYEGTTDDHETTLTITDPTADRTITFPDASGTVAFTSDITGTVDTSGSPVDDDFAKFTDSNTIEGRSIAETKSDLSLDNVENKSSATIRSEIVSDDIPNNAADTSGQAGTVATIAGLAPDTATTQATQPNITTMTGFVTGSANQLITDDGDGTVTSEAGLTWDGDTLDVISSTSGRPQVNIKNTNSNAKGPNLFLINDKGAAGALNDEAGAILFRSDNASQTLVDYGKLSATAVGTLAGDESGNIKLEVRTSDGSSSNTRNVITGTGHNTANDVDVEIGYGATSITTVAGDAVITGNIELGNASDTTIARSAAGTVTIEGEQVFTTNVPDLTSGAAGVPAVTMHTRRTITTAEANSMNTTPIELVPGQGANTVIIPIGGMIRVDRAATQTNSAADLNMHYAGLAPGVYNSTSVAHGRRFMYNETGDRVFHITPMLAASEVAQNLTSDANKALQISFDSATTTDCFTSIDVFLTYQVISIA